MDFTAISVSDEMKEDFMSLKRRVEAERDEELSQDAFTALILERVSVESLENGGDTDE
jgi:hypothetical protein